MQPQGANVIRRLWASEQFVRLKARRRGRRNRVLIVISWYIGIPEKSEVFPVAALNLNFDQRGSADTVLKFLGCASVMLNIW